MNNLTDKTNEDFWKFFTSAKFFLEELGLIEPSSDTNENLDTYFQGIAHNDENGV